MLTYTIFAGINGVGKSTLYEFIKDSKPDLGVRVNPDEILQEFSGNWRDFKDCFNSGRIANDLIKQCLSEKLSFNQETTILVFKTMKTIMKAKELGYKVNLLFIGTDNYQSCQERIENRVQNENKHGISLETLLYRYTNQFLNLKEIINLCDRCLLFENQDHLRVVASYENGKIQNKDDSCKWLNNFFAEDNTTRKKHFYPYKTSNTVDVSQ